MNKQSCFSIANGIHVCYASVIVNLLIFYINTDHNNGKSIGILSVGMIHKKILKSSQIKISFRPGLFERCINIIHWITYCPVDSVVGFVNSFTLDSSLSNGERYTAFEQLGPDTLVI